MAKKNKLPVSKLPTAKPIETAPKSAVAMKPTKALKTVKGMK